MADPLTPEARVRALLDEFVHGYDEALSRGVPVDLLAATMRQAIAALPAAPSGTCGECAHWQRSHIFDEGYCQIRPGLWPAHDGCRLGFTPRTETR